MLRAGPWGSNRKFKTMYRLRCDYEYPDSDNEFEPSYSWDGGHQQQVGNSYSCGSSATSSAHNHQEHSENSFEQNQSRPETNLKTVKKVDLIFRYDTLGRKENKLPPQSQKQPSTACKKSVRSAYRRQLAKESAEALALLSTCNSELETEMIFLANELEAFRRLEQSQRSELQDLHRYAPQTAPNPTEPATSPTESSTGSASLEPSKGKFFDESRSRPLHARTAPRRSRAAQPQPQDLLADGKVGPVADGKEGGATQWRGGAWKKALRMRS
jgi:hypothetical protein